MSDEPQVKIESESAVRNHWFKRVFYKKDGKKLTLIPGRARLVAFTLLFFGYLAFVLQTAQSPAPQGGSFFDVPKESDHEIGANVPPYQKETPRKENAARTGTRAQTVKKYLGPELVTRPKIPIPPGTVAKGKLLSGASNGPVRAELTEPLQVSGETLLPPGAILLGTGTSTEERLLIRFNRLIFQDGTYQSVQAQVFDTDDKLPGLRGSLLGNRAMKLVGSIGLNFVGGLSEGLQETEVRGGVPFRPSTLKNALLNGASRAAIEESRDQMSQLRNAQPIVQVDAGKEILVSFEGN